MKKAYFVFLILVSLLATLTGCRSTTLPAQAQGGITASDAERIALEHAGLTAEQVTRLHTEADRDNGMLHYDVEFHHQGYEYDYEISADAGNILKSQKDAD